MGYEHLIGVSPSERAATNFRHQWLYLVLADGTAESAVTLSVLTGFTAGFTAGFTRNHRHHCNSLSFFTVNS